MSKSLPKIWSKVYRNNRHARKHGRWGTQNKQKLKNVLFALLQTGMLLPESWCSFVFRMNCFVFESYLSAMSLIISSPSCAFLAAFIPPSFAKRTFFISFLSFLDYPTLSLSKVLRFLLRCLEQHIICDSGKLFFMAHLMAFSSSLPKTGLGIQSPVSNCIFKWWKKMFIGLLVAIAV